MFDLYFLTTFADEFKSTIAAISILILGWVLALLLAGVTHKVISKLKCCERLAKLVPYDAEQENCNIAEGASKFVYYIVLLMTFLAFCEKVGLTVFFNPIRSMLDVTFQYLPQIGGALIIILVAFFAAKVLRMIAKGLCTSLNIDQRLSEHISITVTESFSNFVYAFTLFLFLPIVLDALGLRSLINPLNMMFAKIFAYLPSLFSGFIIIAVFYIGALILVKLTTNLLTSIGFNGLVEKTGLFKETGKGKKPADIAGMLILFAVMLLGVSEAANAIGFTILSSLAVQFTIFASQLFTGIVILAIGAFFANLAYQTIGATNSSNRHLLATLAKMAIWFFAGAMALQQIGMANDIINLAFGILLGAIGIAIAVSFGLGGKEIAARELDGWIQSIKKGNSQE